MGVVHHVCNEHSWAGSEGHHGPLVESEPKITKDYKALEKLRSVVFDARFLANLDCYTTFRHTGIIKNCPKNMPQRDVHLTTVVLLAALP